MRITSQNTDETVLGELGRRMARTRLERNITQEQLAREAGIGVATLERMEAGQATRTSSFIRVLRALGLLEGLDAALPEPTPSPLERLKLSGRERRRAATPRVRPPDAPSPWRWGDEAGAGGQ
jgi:transcriptional regulator with XRE-family HTH domain